MFALSNLYESSSTCRINSTSLAGPTNVGIRGRWSYFVQPTSSAKPARFWPDLGAEGGVALEGASAASSRVPGRNISSDAQRTTTVFKDTSDFGQLLPLVM